MSRPDLPFDELNCPWTLDDDAKLVRQVTEEAGRIALSYFARENVHSWDKSPNNPVTEADIAVDEFLRTTLMQNRTGYGWLSEETEDKSDRLRAGRLWIVDPIDGTKAFLDGGDDWGISVALVQDRKPVIGAFYAPVKNKFYFARAGEGATVNNKPIAVGQTLNLCDCVMMGEPMAFRSRKLWPTPWPPTMRSIYENSIALRLCQVADGQYDCCVTLRPKCDWDVAAADLILKEAGGILRTGNQTELVYNRKEPLHDHIIAASPALIPAIMDRVNPALNAWRNAAS